MGYFLSTIPTGAGGGAGATALTVIDVAKYAGADFGIKLTAAMADVPAVGGTLDCRRLTGAQTMAAGVTISKLVEIILGVSTVTAANGVTAFTFAVGSEGSVMRGGGDQSLIQATGSATPLISITNSAGGTASVTLKDFQVKFTSAATAAAIDIFNASGVNRLGLIRLFVTASGFDAIRLRGVYTSVIKECRITGATGNGNAGINFVESVAANSGSGVLVEGNYIFTNNIGLRAELPLDLHLVGNTLENNQSGTSPVNMLLVNGTVYCYGNHYEQSFPVVNGAPNVQITEGSHWFIGDFFGNATANQGLIYAGTQRIVLDGCTSNRGVTNNGTGTVLYHNCKRSNAQGAGTGPVIQWNSPITGGVLEVFRGDAAQQPSFYNWAGILMGGDGTVITAPTATSELTLITHAVGLAGRANPIECYNNGGSLIAQIGGLGRTQLGQLNITPKLGDAPTRVLEVVDTTGAVEILCAHSNLNVGVGTATPSAQLTIVQQVATSGTPQALNVTGAAHTGMTNVEMIDVNFSLARTVTFAGAGGAINIQRAVVVQPPTYAAAAAQTINNAFTFTVTGPPLAGASVTLTNPYTFWVQSGTARFEDEIEIINEAAVPSATGRLRRNGTTLNYAGTFGVRGVVETTGSPTTLNVLGGAHTTLTAAEFIDANFNFGSSAQITSGGAITTMRTSLFQARTYTATAATQTITTAVTLEVGGAPVAGANITITRSAALRIGGTGSIVCASSALATNAVNGFIYLPSCAGTPTGVPEAHPSVNAFVYDTTGKTLWVYDGTWGSFSKGPLAIQIFTAASGTYTPTAGMRFCIVEAVGGGGGGGGVAAQSAAQSGASGGGGGGGYSRRRLTAAQIGASQAVVIGALGSGGPAGNNPGTTGGDTTLGPTLVVAKGGAGGAGAAAAAIGLGGGGGSGAGGTGDIRVDGGQGVSGIASGTATGPFLGGIPGSTLLGSPGNVPAGGTGSGISAGPNSYGVGGSGGIGANAAAQVGGSGMSGIMIITEY